MTASKIAAFMVAVSKMPFAEYVNAYRSGRIKKMSEELENEKINK